MRTLSVTICLFTICVELCFAVYDGSSNYFCRDLHRQQTVDISQLEGIWYLIEKIVHTEDMHMNVNLTTCPVIHISEDRTPYASSKNYDTTYGSGYPHIPQNIQANRNPIDPRSTFSSDMDYIKQQEEYDRRTTYDYDRRRGFHSLYMKTHFGMKHLKIFISDGSTSLEHHVRYNSSNPGFWIMSGPEEAQDNLKHFAGTTQVMKAVGDHLVLTFCQPSRETKQLYTMILSRENYLRSWDVHTVHGLLIQQGLRTTYIERTCNTASSISLSLGLSLIIVLIYSTNFFHVSN